MNQWRSAKAKGVLAALEKKRLAGEKTEGLPQST